MAPEMVGIGHQQQRSNPSSLSSGAGMGAAEESMERFDPSMFEETSLDLGCWIPLAT